MTYEPVESRQSSPDHGRWQCGPFLERVRRSKECPTSRRTRLKKVITSLLEFSSLRKSNTLLGGTGSQNEVAALSTIPGGRPGSSMLFLVMTRTSSAPLPESVVHVWAVEAPTPTFALSIEGGNPTAGPEGKARIDECLVNGVHGPIVYFDMLDPCYLANNIPFGSSWMRQPDGRRRHLAIEVGLRLSNETSTTAQIFNEYQITSSLNRAFSIRRCCSSNDISPMAAGPPQLGQVALLKASL
ncbi:R-phycocyanin-2 subunit alpha [Striga asiatica]|uniref:R-phycocyanin-2 subunit alpha n=1 Tax=Striga asiatica TaxID=4170 RepID=A0A5A7QIY6_STRAF|nr:R-phycocyanin-2 subunit alpha [Striga asiatica]